MDVEKLKVLLQIAESGSIQGAARQLGVSRSFLRRSLEVLEADVGAPVLHRDASGARLTAAGAVLVEQGRAVVESWQALLANARAATSGPTGVVRSFEPIGGPLGLRVAGLMATHAVAPHLRLVVRHVEQPLGLSREPFELMLHEGPPPDRNEWFSRVVTRAPLRLVASQGYLEQRGRPMSVADLVHHDTIGWQRPGHPGDEWPLLGGGTVHVSPWVVSSDHMMLEALAAAGGGILLTVRSPVIDPPAGDVLVPVLEEQVGGEFTLRATTPFPSRADPSTREALRLIVEHLEGFPEE